MPQFVTQTLTIASRGFHALKDSTSHWTIVIPTNYWTRQQYSLRVYQNRNESSSSFAKSLPSTDYANIHPGSHSDHKFRSYAVYIWTTFFNIPLSKHSIPTSELSPCGLYYKMFLSHCRCLNTSLCRKVTNNLF